MNILIFLILSFIIVVLISSVFNNDAVTFILFTIFFIINFYIISNKHAKIIKEENFAIYSTTNQPNFKISGNFVLGSGTINSKEIYLANVKINKNTYKRIYIPVKKTLRIIDKNLTDKAIYIKYTCRAESFGIILNEGNCYDLTYRNKQPIYDKLYIPQNAIVKLMNFQ
jgi:hypothetical protein